MGIRTNKLRQIINYMEENQFNILLTQEANVDFKHKKTRTYIERMLEQKYHITVSEKTGGNFRHHWHTIEF
jgi:ferritin